MGDSRYPNGRVNGVTALLSAAATAGAGCLVPQQVVLDEAEAPTNHPPFFDTTADVKPLEALVCVSSLDEAPTEFRLGNVQDADGHPLEARWFIDYDGGFTAIQRSETLTRDSEALFYPATTFSSDDIDPYHRTLGTPFVLEVVVSDGFGAAGRAPRQRAPADNRYVTSYRWSVYYRTGSPCE